MVGKKLICINQNGGTVNMTKNIIKEYYNGTRNLLGWLRTKRNEKER
jgi:hypothetical protein